MNNETGGFPSVTTSTNLVHVAYTAGDRSIPINNGELAKTRIRNNGVWETTSTDIFANADMSKVFATGTKLHAFYYVHISSSASELHHVSRSLSGGTWSSVYVMAIGGGGNPHISPVDLAVTADDRLHAAFAYGYRQWDENNGGWTNQNPFGNYSGT